MLRIAGVSLAYQNRTVMTTAIEQATSDDAEAIARIHLSSMRAAFEGQLPNHVAQSVLDISDVQQRTRGWTGWLKRSRASTIVARLDGTVVGFCALHPMRDETVNGSIREFASLYVLSSHWRRGIGRLLCEQILREARTFGLAEVMLWVLESNEPARLFYDSLGFRPAGKPRVFFESAHVSLSELRLRRAT